MRVSGEISEPSAGPTCDEPVVDPKTDEEKDDLEHFLDHVQGNAALLEVSVGK